MLKNIPRISVYVITYNQIDVIDRTLKSILDQKDYVYEICISDDHSTDGTWERLLYYSEQYTGLFKLNRNNPNLGIFENTEKVWSMVSGDIVHDLAGDDCVGPNWFKTVVEYIQDNNIDYKNEMLCIYGDYMTISVDGEKSIIDTNSIVASYPKEAMSLAIRGLLCMRSACFSINVLKKFRNLSKGKSYMVEDAMEKQLQLYTDRNYYIKQVGNIYYTGKGVSVNMSAKDRDGRIGIFEYSLDFLMSSTNLPARDVFHLRFKDSLMKWHHNRSLSNLIDSIRYSIISFVPKYYMNKSFMKQLYSILYNKFIK